MKKTTIISPDPIDAEESDYLFVAPSQIPNAGKGLFTAIPIYKNEIISVFKGEMLSEKEAKIRADQGKDMYFIVMPDGQIMDSKNTECYAKYANDSEGPVKTAYKLNSVITLDDDENVCVVANRSIKSGEEIFCGYGEAYWEKHRNDIAEKAKKENCRN